MNPAAVFRLLFFLFLSLHALKLIRLVPIESLADKPPLVQHSHCESYTDIVRDRAFLNSNRDPFGYDPYVAGGELAGLGLNPASTAPILFDRVVRFILPPETSYRIFVLLSLFAGPLLLYVAARLFRVSPFGSLLAAVLFSAGMVSFDRTSSDLIYKGQVSFWIGTVVAMFNAACLYRFSIRNDWRVVAGFLLSALALPVFSPAISAVQLFPLLIMVLRSPSERRRNTVLWFVAAVVLAVGVNLGWLPAYVDALRLGSAGADWKSGGWTAIREFLVPSQGGWNARVEAALRVSLLAFGVVRLGELAREQRQVYRGIAPWAWIAGLIGFFGSSVPILSNAECSRFLFLLTTVLLIPAVASVSALMARPRTVWLFVIGWLVWFSFTWQLVDERSPAPLRTDVSPRETRLAADLRRLPPGERVLVQYVPLFTDGLRLSAVDGRHTFAGFAGSGWTTRGGTYGSFVRFEDDWDLFGTPLRSFTEASLTARLRQFNISHVVTTTPAVRRYFSRMKSFRELPSFGAGAYDVFALENPSHNGYLISGSGRVSVEFGGFRIQNASSGTLITAFLWKPGLRSNSGVTVRSAELDGFSVPFIAVDNPSGVKDLEVYVER